MDATLKGIFLTKDNVEKIFNEILNININDGVSFKIISIKDIRLEDEYGGFRLNILSKLDYNKTYITVELTTGDIITPREMKYNYNSIFEDKKIPILTYTIETILAEKFQTVIARGGFNTRLKDFYDIYILAKTKINDIDKKTLVIAIESTFKRRETKLDINYFNAVINSLTGNDNPKDLWSEYRNKNTYAKGISFEDIIDSVKIIVNILKETLVTV